MRKATTYHYSEGDVRQFMNDGLKTTNKRIDTLSDKVNTLSGRVNTLSDKVNSLSNKFDEFKNKVYELFDKLMGELKAIREEQTIIVSYKEQIEDHETRIGKIEEVLEPNPTSA